ncbi:MAG: [Fe-S]-binding protein, partial [Spirochaetes bacterium]|nr:[Fe-S]-binding protein [Spirochaetota bacterium]
SFPNNAIWHDLKQYANDKWQLIIGFTELPEELIFKNKAVLFKYALVFIQEMDKKKIDLAPHIGAGDEVQRVYGTLGVAVNDIAGWLKKKYQIKCQSNHPLGGLVNTSPLAGKAGLGWVGCNGLLITPEFGPRHRIAPVFIEQKFFEFTDNLEHQWLEEFCQTCHKCYQKCPASAIYEEKLNKKNHIPVIGHTRTCIDRDKCYPQFSRTLGCSICMKVCPFSQGKDVYMKLKKLTEKKKRIKIGKS